MWFLLRIQVIYVYLSVFIKSLFRKMFKGIDYHQEGIEFIFSSSAVKTLVKIIKHVISDQGKDSENIHICIKFWVSDDMLRNNHVLNYNDDHGNDAMYFSSFSSTSKKRKRRKSQATATKKRLKILCLDACVCVCDATLLMWLVYHLHLRHVINMILWRFLIVEIIHAMSISILRITSYHFVSLRITSYHKQENHLHAM